MKRVFATVSVLAAVVGCGGSNIVPVSGVVQLNGKPYKNAIVSFQPTGSKDAPNPGRGSAGVTDEQGRFKLIYDGEKPGALIGRHRVRIFTQFGSGSSEEGAAGRKASKAGSFVERIPPEWNENSEKEFEVPSGGTDAANFDIQTRPASK
jgi:hypothetical protein